MFPKRTFLTSLFIATSVIGQFSLAEEEAENPKSPSSPFAGAKKSVDDLGRYFDNLFSTELPFIGPDSVWEFDIMPKFGDIVDDEFIRLPLEATYGFSDSLEASIGYTPYLENPIDSDPVDSDGYVHLSFKKRFKNFLGERWDFAIGANAQKPLDDIPDDYVRANYTVYRPYLVFSRTLGDTERWRFYSNASYELVGDYVHDTQTYMKAPDSLFSLQQGVIYKTEGEWRYSMELEFATTRFDGEEDNHVVLKPGVTWFPSEERRERWIIPGDYSLGLTVGYAFDQLNENKDRSDLRVGVKFRWRLRAK